MENYKSYKDFVNLFLDGEPVNKDPLTEIPDPELSLYEFTDGIISMYFDTEEELNEYLNINKPGFGFISTVDYLGDVAGKHDVIRHRYIDGKFSLHTLCNFEGYLFYNKERSFYRGEYVWEFYYGDLAYLYKAFRDRGIVFTDDLYARMDEERKNFFKMLEQRKTSNE